MAMTTTSISSIPSSSNPMHFVEQPKSEWIVRSRPAQFRCIAANAQRIRIKCNTKWLDDDRIYSERFTDPTSGEPSIRANVEIQRAELDAWFADLGEFACQCWAFSQQNFNKDNEDLDSEDEEEDDDEDGDNEEKTTTRIRLKDVKPPTIIRSDIAMIRLAYLRKHFNQVPISQRVHEGKTVQLQCHPPEGDPKPDIFWHKDGQQLHLTTGDVEKENKKNNQNLIQAGDGSLILSSIHLSDSGNYSCEARNPARRVFTDPAHVNVYVDGGWSPWSEWEGHCTSIDGSASIDCPVLLSQVAMVRGDEYAVRRVLPRQRRTRMCNNPVPLNDGAACEGAIEQFKECTHSCRLDGAWGQWGAWSSHCDAHCRRERKRKCTAPEYANGGQPCLGESQQLKNCTDSSISDDIPENCLPGSPRFLSSLPHSSFSARPLFDSQLLAGCIAILLLVVALLAALLFFARKKRTKGSGICGESIGGMTSGMIDGMATGIFLDSEEKLYFPSVAVATKTEDEMGNVRTILLSSEDQKYLRKAGLGVTSVGPSPARFYTGTNALHSTVSTPVPSLPMANGIGQMTTFYTLRSCDSRNGCGSCESVQPYASGQVNGCVQRPSSRLIKPALRQQRQDIAGSRVALLPEYSSGSSSSNGSQRNKNSDHYHNENQSVLSIRDENNEDENNYATLYEEVAEQHSTSKIASTESLADDSSATCTMLYYNSRLDFTHS